MVMSIARYFFVTHQVRLSKSKDLIQVKVAYNWQQYVIKICYCHFAGDIILRKPTDLSFTQWHSEGRQASYVRARKSPGGILDLLEVARPAGDMSRPALTDIVLFQDLLGGCRVRGNLGDGPFNVTSRKGGFYLAAPDFATTSFVYNSHEIRALSFPVAQWQSVFDETADGRGLCENLRLYRGSFNSPIIQSTLLKLWALSQEEDGPSRLLARAAGCEILAELYRLSGAPLTSVKGGLAPWTKRRCQELMHARLSEDISLDELAAEAQLSPYHFARMFKQSVGVTPRVYLTQLRIEKACELLALTNLSITEIASNIGYSSSQVLSRVFFKYQHMSPTDYRRALRGTSYLGI
jgi:AraC family transcriptional regulator